MTAADLIAKLKKQPIGVACGLVCLVCIGWLYYRSGELEALQLQYEAKASERAMINSNVTNSKNLPEQVAELQGLTKELDGRLVKAGQLAVNLQYFYKLEAENEVKLLDVRQNPVPRGAKAPVGVPYTVNVQGSYKQVMLFLQRLESGRHFCRITSATFVKNVGMADPSVTLALNLELLGQP